MNKIDKTIQRIKQKILDKNFELNPVISIEVIHQFEKQNNIVFPEELVLFYTLIGNGGKMFGGYPIKKFEDLNIDIEKAKKEFPFTDYWIWEDEEDNIDTDFDIIGNGNIELIDIGCCQTWNIIITGKERGNMWLFTDVGIGPSTQKPGFLSWYECYLDGNYNCF